MKVDRVDILLLFVTLIAAFCLGCSSGSDGVLGDRANPELVEGGAVFRYHNPDAKRVYLVGDFNNWSPYADPMKDIQGDGSWELFFPMAPGLYSYKLVVDGRWIPDPHNPLSEPDGFGGYNSVVKILAFSPSS
jgi:1,4-alpha-glucan branching enzyme